MGDCEAVPVGCLSAHVKALVVWWVTWSHLTQNLLHYIGPGGTEMLLTLRVTFLTVLHRKLLLVFDSPKKFMTISQG